MIWNEIEGASVSFDDYHLTCINHFDTILNVRRLKRVDNPFGVCYWLTEDGEEVYYTPTHFAYEEHEL